MILSQLHPSFPFGVSARPYTLLVSSKPACTFVDLPSDTQLMINYHAPDLVLDTDNSKSTKKHPYEKEISDSHLKEDSSLIPNEFDGDLTDAQKRKQKLQEMVNDISSQHSDMTITISKKRGRPLKKIPLEHQEGSAIYETSEDGTLQICTQSIMASRNFPRRIFMRVYVYQYVDDHIVPNQDGLDHGFSAMEAQLHALTRDMQNILKFADFNKDTQWNFAKVNRDMNDATARWPFIQIFCLIGTGLMQVGYMLKFFKNRHLI